MFSFVLNTLLNIFPKSRALPHFKGTGIRINWILIEIGEYGQNEYWSWKIDPGKKPVTDPEIIIYSNKNLRADAHWRWAPTFKNFVKRLTGWLRESEVRYKLSMFYLKRCKISRLHRFFKKGRISFSWVWLFLFWLPNINRS